MHQKRRGCYLDQFILVLLLLLQSATVVTFSAFLSKSSNFLYLSKIQRCKLKKNLHGPYVPLLGYHIAASLDFWQQLKC